MLEMSLNKLLLLALVIGGVWYYSKIKRRMAAREKRAGADAGARAQRPSAIEAEEMAQCPRCGTYIPAERPKACGRADCPYGARVQEASSTRR